MTRMLGSDAILRSLEAEGVEFMFGIPGGAILPTYDAIARGTTVRHVLARHEQGAGHMAEGYARASGRVGVAMATSGPGATNLVTAIADAWMDSTPIVCITGQVRSNLIGTDAFQETDATGITMPIVKHSWLVLDARELPQAIKNAFHVARTGRPGPVLVDVAKDAQEGELDFSYPADVELPGWRPPTKVHERQVHEAAKAIVEARQPIIYAGGGVLNADASAELLALVETARLPAVVTLMGKGGLPDSHPLNYGAPGMHGSKYANWALNKSDLIIAVGVRFDDRVTGKVSAFAPGAKVIHFDIDAAEVGKIRDADIPVVGPLKLALSQLTRDVKALEAEKRSDRSVWHAQLEEWRALYPYKYRREEGVLKPQTVIETLRDLTGRSRGRVRLDNRCRPAPDVGDAVPPLREAADVHHVGRARDDGHWPAGRRRGQGGPAGRDGDLRRRRRLLPDDLPGARDRGARAAADRRRDHQQRLARDGAPVAGALLRRALRRDPPDQAGPRLRPARRGARGGRLHGRQRGRARLDARGCARLRSYGRRRRPRRPRRELLPDGSRRRGVGRHHRAARRGRRRGEDPRMSQHTVSVELENKPGALARVSQMFARRGYNIQSLAVGPTERPDISRLTLRVDCSQHSLEQIEKQMHKLVNVLRVVELRPGESVERELALITVGAPADKRGELIALGEVFGARVADIGREALTFEIVGRPEELDAFEELVRPHGVRELARTGRIGLRRAGPRPARSSAASVS